MEEFLSHPITIGNVIGFAIGYLIISIFTPKD